MTWAHILAAGGKLGYIALSYQGRNIVRWGRVNFLQLYPSTVLSRMHRNEDINIFDLFLPYAN